MNKNKKHSISGPEALWVVTACALLVFIIWTCVNTVPGTTIEGDGWPFFAILMLFYTLFRSMEIRAKNAKEARSAPEENTDITHKNKKHYISALEALWTVTACVIFAVALWMCVSLYGAAPHSGYMWIYFIAVILVWAFMKSMYIGIKNAKEARLAPEENTDITHKNKKSYVSGPEVLWTVTVCACFAIGLWMCLSLFGFDPHIGYVWLYFTATMLFCTLILAILGNKNAKKEKSAQTDK